MVKKRADVLLFEAGLAPSREHARQLILAGKVLADGKPVTKPSTLIGIHSFIKVTEESRYVSRGGFKLEYALKEFKIDVSDADCVDIGASTGGFTDCLLQHGARHVVAIDVGYGQLAWSLRTDPRVTVMERANIRHIEPESIEHRADIAVADVSFISLAKVLPSIAGLLKPSGKLIALVKPQFEAGRENVGKHGVVRDAAIHEEVLQNVWTAFDEQGFTVQDITYSPIKGPEGNIEFLIYAVYDESLADSESSRQQSDMSSCKNKFDEERIKAVVENAHSKLI